MQAIAVCQIAVGAVAQTVAAFVASVVAPDGLIVVCVVLPVDVAAIVLDSFAAHTGVDPDVQRNSAGVVAGFG